MSIKNRKIIFFLGTLFCFLLIKTDFILAFEAAYPPVFGLSIGDGTLPEYARYFFNIGIAIAGILATIVIIFGGIYYLVSLGRGQFTDEGKQWIKAGVFGLILTVSSYLIAATINPNLVVFQLDKLLPTSFNIFSSQSPTDTTPFVYYDEIPIGTLIENTLSRTMNCYDYDGNGDPIEGKITTDDNQVINGPTLLNHDRVDCLVKLTEAAEKKSKIIKKVSDEITRLMSQCSCAGKCNPTVQAQCASPVGGKCPKVGYNGAACRAFPGQEGKDCCPPGVKEIIEHGPTIVSDQADGFDYSGKRFKGLDEFRTQLTNISDFIEINPKPKVDGKEIAIINNGNCQICDNDNASCQNSRKSCLQNSKWGNLKLIEQLMYFKEKMEQIKSATEKDRDQLQSAENKLGQCYLAEPYVDFLKTVEKTRKEEKVIVSQKTFADPETKQQIDVYKYCKGFDYANSNSYSMCQNICPETLKDKSCYNDCKKCNEKDPQSQAKCIAAQTQCVKKCYDKHECPVVANNNPPFTTFDKCIQGLNQQCSISCDKKYASTQKDELAKCKAKCGNNSASKCLLENEEKCTVNFPQLKFCSDNYKNPDDIKNCINNSFLCKYGSDEYAGYPDCTKTQGQYSSSYIYKNPDDQRCKNPYQPYTSGTSTGQTCLSFYPETAKCPTASECPKCPCGIIDETINYNSGETGGGGSGGPCDGKPMKFCSDGTISCNCPIIKACPDGSCIGFDGICSPGNCSETTPTPIPTPPPAQIPNGESSGGSTTILEYQVAVGTCGESSYNDDPLTFYCQQNWWSKENKVEEKNTVPIGKEKVCSKDNEIPIGQTVDDTEKWVNELGKNIDNFTKTINEMVQYVKSIGQEQGYGQCNSTCENGRPCSTSCRYVAPKIATDTTPAVPALCSPQACNGISMQKMINLLNGGKTENCPVPKNGIFYYYDKIYKGSKDFYKFLLVDGRSDIVKELSYSRKKMDKASTDQSAFGQKIKILSCTRALDEIISPIKEGAAKTGSETIKSYCYGKNLGEILKTPEPMADNWFYCEERQGINK